MKIFPIYIFFLAITHCSSDQSENQITKPEELKVSKTISFKHFDDVQVFQFYDNDSLNAKITNSKKLDSNNNIVAEYYKDYQIDKFNGTPDLLKTNEYNRKNQLIISTYYYKSPSKRNEIYKYFYYYNDTLLTRLEVFELKKRLKENLEKGIGSQNGDIITPEDYETKPTWKLVQMILFKYNNKGLKIEEYSPIYRSSNNRFVYQYDSDGNLINEKSYNESEILYTKNYSYELNQVTSNLEWKNKDYISSKSIKKFDENGNLIKLITIKNDIKIIKLYNYNSENKLTQYYVYDENEKKCFTHIIKYKK